MDTNTTDYLLLFRGGESWAKDLPQEKAVETMNRMMAWIEKMHNEGTGKSARPLGREGRTVSGKGGRTVADGPFAESKEAVAGYFMLSVASLDEAVAIAKQCPMLEFGQTVEVRPVLGECPHFKAVREQAAMMAAAAAAAV
jgi:hypothetical protein